jgi:predicted dehydrogenase
MSEKINVAVVGLNFGANFAACYKFHPMVGELSLCDLNRTLVERVGDRLDVKKRFYKFEDVLTDPTIDAVHLLTNIPDHDTQSVAVLEAEKHCACAVPMAITAEGIQKVIAAQKKSGKSYMLMETIIFTRNFFYALELINTGTLGNIQFIKGAHWQDMEGWPKYWRGMPPMFYASHALAPAFVATKSRAKRVTCLGSGRMREYLYAQYNNKFPMENALYEMEDQTVVEIARTLFHCARGYTESFTICGDNAGFETGQKDTDLPILYKYIDNGKFDPEQVSTVGRITLEDRIDPPDRLDLLPRELHRFTRPHMEVNLTNPADIYEYTSATGGYHPHVVNSFVRYITGGKKPYFDLYNSADLTAACICAHNSALKDGKWVEIPKYYQ